MLPYNKYFDLGLTEENPTDTYLIPLFSIPIMHIKINDWNTKKKRLLEMYYKRKSNSEVFKTANHNVYDVETDYHYNFNCDVDNVNNDRDKSDLEVSELVDQIFNDELDFICDTFEMGVSVGNAWFERAVKNKFHSIHNHGVRGLSCVVFINFDHKKHTPTSFINPITASEGPICPQIEMPPGVREGSLLVFPSYLNHFTEPNESDVERIILSFNLLPEWEHEKFFDVNEKT